MAPDSQRPYRMIVVKAVLVLIVGFVALLIGGVLFARLWLRSEYRQKKTFTRFRATSESNHRADRVGAGIAGKKP